MKVFFKKSSLSFSLSICLLFLLNACHSENKKPTPSPEMNWTVRETPSSILDSLESHSSYLSVYSQIYSYTAEETYSLTATVSIHNTSTKDTIFIKSANYYNKHGEQIRSYLSNPIFVKPLESIQIVIAETDEAGGTGANFIFDWATKNETTEPFFEAVMISTSGQQGMSFTTQGVRTK